jgi:triphosphoribosyl-dephospho-CoA synthase
VTEPLSMTAELHTTPPQLVGACATLACIWEATAPKPGNVYRGADFEDVTFADFLTSAAVIGPLIEQVTERGVGQTVLQAIQATQAAVATNTNLGMMLLITPLAAVPAGRPLADNIGEVLCSCTAEDTRAVYQAISAAQPGGLGEVDEADVSDTQVPEISLLEAMQLATDRDLVARQYTNDFEQVFQTADRMQCKLQNGLPLSEAIVYAYLQLLAEYPDSLIVRKCGLQLGQEVQRRAAAVLDQGEPSDEAYQRAMQDLDFWLRADGHRRNPGTSADIVAAGLFVLLREQRLDWPVNFYDGAAEG